MSLLEQLSALYEAAAKAKAPVFAVFITADSGARAKKLALPKLGGRAE